MMDKMKVLVTGAAGLVGGHLREFWGDRYQLRLSDIKPMDNLATHEEYVEMDITNYDAFLAACQGMDALVHLAADPSMDAEFYETLLPLNIIGCYNGFERDVSASSSPVALTRSSAMAKAKTRCRGTRRSTQSMCMGRPSVLARR